jgi:hypothetical protein
MPSTAKQLSKESRSPVVTVHVRDKDIREAIPADSSHCMIADAIQSQVKGATRVSVDIQTIRWTDAKKKLRFIYLTPPAAQWAILRFDEGKRPEPFALHLRGGQVIEARPKTKAEKEHLKKLYRTRYSKAAKEKTAKKVAKLDALKSKKAPRLKKTLTNEDRNGAVPSIVGGNAPPTTTVGRRRTFGLKTFAHA